MPEAFQLTIHCKDSTHLKWDVLGDKKFSRELPGLIMQGITVKFDLLQGGSVAANFDPESIVFVETI